MTSSPSHDRQSLSATCERRVLIVAELDRTAPATMHEWDALERSCARCFQAHRVTIVGVIATRDGEQIRLLLRSPDVESARQLLRRLAISVERIWSCGAEWEKLARDAGSASP